MPPKGEALTNPFYAVQRFAEALGARAAWDRALTIPSTDSIIVLSGWHWTLTSGRREALERWVESGGRLVVDASVADGENAFVRWSGIVRRGGHAYEAEEYPRPNFDGDCRRLPEFVNEKPSSYSPETSYRICDLETSTHLVSERATVWALRDRGGIQAVRVALGRGSVTVINGTPFVQRRLFDGDHGWLFVAATEMRRGDHVLFVSEGDHPSLLALVWQHGAPVVVLTLALVVFALWRGSVRFGPLVAPPDGARRSLAEQIRGTGQFALRYGSGDSLHAACVRALDEAARRRIPGYARLSARERVAALARCTGLDRDALAAAHLHAGTRRAERLENSIARLEAARRHMLIDHNRKRHERSRAAEDKTLEVLAG